MALPVMNIYLSESKMRNKKKICFISTYAYPLFNKDCKATHGGSELQLFQLGKRLKEEGYEVSFLVGNFGQKPVENYDGIKVYRQKLIKPKWLNIKGMWYFYQLQSFRAMRDIKADVYVVRGAGPDIFYQSLYAFLAGAKFIFMTASDVDADGRYEKMFPEAARYYRKGLKMADMVICQSKIQQEKLEENHHLESRILKNSIEILSEGVNISEKKSILWVSSSQPLKQPEIFLKVVERYPQYDFVMIMPKHSKELWNEIFEKAKKYSNLEFIEKVPFEKIGAYFQKAKIFINTSTYEGFPNTFLQSAARKTSILSSNVNPDNFLNEWNCGYCADGDEEVLISRVGELMENEELWKEKSENAFRYVKEIHDLKNNAEKFKQYIDEVLKKQ